jgi:hypothetical protein
MATPSTQLLDQLKRKQLSYLLRQTGSRLVDLLQPIIIFGGLVVTVLLKIPWLKDLRGHVGLADTDGATQTLIVLILASVYLEVRTLAQRMDQVGIEKMHLPDPMDVYPVLLDRAKSITRTEEMCLDVLGMSLYTAWPSIGFWLGRPELRGWTIRMAAPVKAEPGVAALVPTEWLHEARANLSQIRDAAQSPTVIKQNIKLEGFGYDFMPFLHGFRLGNGDLFYSLLMWSDDGKISREKYSYEFVPREDASPSADAAREVFDSWFKRACRNP